MIMFMITKPGGKLKKLLTAGALVLLLGVVVPGVYFALSDLGAMSLFAAGDSISDGEEAPEPPADNNAEQTAADTEDEAEDENAEQTAADAEEEAEDEDAGQTAADIEEKPQDEDAEQTAADTEEEPRDEDAGQTAADNAEEPQDEKAGQTAADEEKPGFWDSLKTLIFGEQPQVQPY